MCRDIKSYAKNLSKTKACSSWRTICSSKKEEPMIILLYENIFYYKHCHTGYGQKQTQNAMFPEFKTRDQLQEMFENLQFIIVMTTKWAKRRVKEGMKYSLACDWEGD